MVVLVVEDNKDAAESLCALFTQRGHQCLIAHTAEAAANVLSTTVVNGMIMDLYLPGSKNGWELLDAMDQGTLPKTHVIVISGWAHVEPPVQDHRVPLLIKPYDPAELINLAERNFSQPLT